MATPELQAEAVRRQLETVLRSPGFARNDRLSRFLRFVVEQQLDGRASELKESVIAIEAIGRDPDHNPKLDPVVRTEARRLRARLREYYEGPGSNDEIVIELPKGGYVPLILPAIQPAMNAAVADVAAEAPVERAARPMWPVLVAGVAILVLIVVGWTRFGPGGHRATARTEAYDLYLRGRILLKRPALRGVEDSIDLFTQAASKDPSFAPAFAGIAAGLAARSGFDQFNDAERADMLAKGWTAAAAAVRLDRRSADAQDALGMMQARAAQWPQAESSFRRAIGLAPRDPLWRGHLAGFLLLPLDRKEEAIAELLTAVALDPSDRAIHSALVNPLLAVGRPEEADSHCLRAAENDQQAGSCWGSTLGRQGKSDQGIRTLEASLNGHVLEPGAAQALGVAYARAGRREDAERMAALAPRLASKAQIYAALRDKDRTLDLLDQMAPMGPTRLGRDFLNSSNFAFLRGDPRLNELRKKVGLPQVQPASDSVSENPQ
jgi:Flp pilus assembly protein TadD